MRFLDAPFFTNLDSLGAILASVGLPVIHPRRGMSEIWLSRLSVLRYWHHLIVFSLCVPLQSVLAALSALSMRSEQRSKERPGEI